MSQHQENAEARGQELEWNVGIHLTLKIALTMMFMPVLSSHDNNVRKAV